MRRKYGKLLISVNKNMTVNAQRVKKIMMDLVPKSLVLTPYELWERKVYNKSAVTCVYQVRVVAIEIVIELLILLLSLWMHDP